MTLVSEKTAIFEKGDYLYLVSPIAPFEPGASDLEEFSFAADLRQMAPNENLLWLRGTYVEADRANENGQEWSGEDISIKSLSPRLMPVTVMHDLASAVGLIADTKLVPAKDGKPARIDNVIAVWSHRFPDVAEEIAVNYKAGTLMQSQECLPAYYDCGECGQRFPKLPGGAEKKNWCAHLRGETSASSGPPVRRLGNVTFTGTGLIFGTQGARGALDSAHLELLQEEVAEFHERGRTAQPTRASRRTSTVDIDQKQYEDLVAKAAQVDDLKAKVATLEETAGKVPDLEKKIEESAIAQKKAEDDLATEKTERTKLEEASRAATLATERFGKLGSKFTAKLPDTVKTTLTEQAKKLSDEEWTARVEELSGLVGVKSDEGEAEDAGSGGGKGNEFSREETSRTTGGSGGSGGSGNGEPSRAGVSQVVGGILDGLTPKPPTKEKASA